MSPLTAVGLVLATVIPSPNTPPEPIGRAEFEHYLAEWQESAPRVEGARLVWVEMSFGFFVGGGHIYIYQTTSTSVNDDLCEVRLLSYGLRRSMPPPRPGTPGIPPDFGLLLTTDRYAPHEGMITTPSDDPTDQRPCEGLVEYRRSFAAPDRETAIEAHALIRRLYGLSLANPPSAMLTCRGAAERCTRLSELLGTNRLDGASRCEPANDSSPCMQFSLSDFDTLYAGGWRLKVSTDTSFVDGALDVEITSIPSPPPV